MTKNKKIYAAHPKLRWLIWLVGAASLVKADMNCSLPVYGKVQANDVSVSFI